MSTVLGDDWRAVLGIVSGGHFLSHFYILALPPLFPILRDEFALNNTELGVIVAVIMVGGLLPAPVGNVVDRVGAKWELVAGIGAMYLIAGGLALSIGRGWIVRDPRVAPSDED